MSDHVPDGDPSAYPGVEGTAPVFRASDHDGMAAFQGGSHAVGTARPLRPCGPGGQVAVLPVAKQTLASPARQDASTWVGHGDQPIETGNLPGRVGGQAAELG